MGRPVVYKWPSILVFDLANWSCSQPLADITPKRSRTLWWTVVGNVHHTRKRLWHCKPDPHRLLNKWKFSLCRRALACKEDTSSSASHDQGNPNTVTLSSVLLPDIHSQHSWWSCISDHWMPRRLKTPQNKHLQVQDLGWGGSSYAHTIGSSLVLDSKHQISGEVKHHTNSRVLIEVMFAISVKRWMHLKDSEGPLYQGLTLITELNVQQFMYLLHVLWSYCLEPFYSIKL